MTFVEGPEKLLSIVADMGLVLFTVLEDLGRLVPNDRLHGCDALLGVAFFAICFDQIAQREYECIGTSLVLDPVTFERVFPFLVDREYAFDKHLRQVIERSCGLHQHERCCQRQEFVRLQVFHLGRVQGSCLDGQLLDFALRYVGEQLGRKQFALLRDDKQVINEVAQVHEGRTGRLLFELFPAGETSAILDNEERVQGGSCLLRNSLRDPAVEAARGNGSDVVRRFVQRGKGREFKAFPGEFFHERLDPADLNSGFAAWGSLLGDEVLATALLDRLLHHAEVIPINGRSYRMKDRSAGAAGGGQT